MSLRLDKMPFFENIAEVKPTNFSVINSDRSQLMAEK